MDLVMMINILAIDIGGTHIKHGLVDEIGTISTMNTSTTPTDFKGFIEHLTTLKEQFQDIPLTSIAISSPGLPQPDGTIGAESAVPYLHQHNIKQAVEKIFHLPVVIENDANCAALAEVWTGKAKSIDNAAVLIIGTGIGGALIQNRTLHRGADQHAGDFGYMLLPNRENGGYSVFSRLASTGSIIRRVADKKAMSKNDWTGEKVFNSAEEGDIICQEAIHQFYTMLGLGIFNIQYVYNPDVILIGGGISTRPTLLDELNQHLHQLQQEVEETLIIPKVDICDHKSHANLIGAAYCYFQSIKASNN
ncbi:MULTISPECIES: ROK family protein [Halolactibacillus]|nr:MULTISPECIES: ROK family protein [Halolactibacillus]